MPRPPILKTIDWKKVFNTGIDFKTWLGDCENPEHVRKMHSSAASIELDERDLDILGEVHRDIHIVAIAEDWCGDVVRHVPVLEQLVRNSSRLRVRYITRDQHRDVFARYLTNGGESIPKFIFLNDQYVECGNWGPMPNDCRRLIACGKACGNVAVFREKVNELYKADGRFRAVIQELLDLIQIASTLGP